MDVEMIRRITKIVRQADQRFMKVGGTTRHYVIECLIPCLEENGLTVHVANGEQCSVCGDNTTNEIPVCDICGGEFGDNPNWVVGSNGAKRHVYATDCKPIIAASIAALEKENAQLRKAIATKHDFVKAVGEKAARIAAALMEDEQLGEALDRFVALREAELQLAKWKANADAAKVSA